MWKEVTDLHVNVSGTWKRIREGWVNVSGTWKQFYAALFTTEMTRGSILNNEGYEDGTVTVGFGSLSDDQYDGNTVRGIYTTVANLFVVRIAGTLAQDFFSTVDCSVGTFDTSTATHVQSGGNTSWTWATGARFTISGTEDVTFTK